jgi:hypothetical protein
VGKTRSGPGSNGTLGIMSRATRYTVMATREPAGTYTYLWDDGDFHILFQDYGAKPQLLIDVSGHSGIIHIIVAYTTQGIYTANFAS